MPPGRRSAALVRTQDVSVKVQCAIQIGDLQMDVPNAHIGMEFLEGIFILMTSV